jgi:hypothetical protein
MNEHPTTLRPGDTVVSLRHLSIECALVTGCITAGILLYRAGLSSSYVIAEIAAGSFGGFGAGSILARILFPVQPGHVFVVRRARNALPLTLRAALVPFIITAFCAVAIIAAVGLSPLSTGLLVGTLVAVLIGCVIGCASALVK